MQRNMHVFDFIEQTPADVPAVCVLHGDEPFLKREALRILSQQISPDDPAVDTWEGDSAEWRDVVDELSTAALFGPARRVVHLRDADKFVTQHRAALEKYVADASTKSVLILDVGSFPGNTRLAKLVTEHGLAIACKAPEAKNSKSKAIDVSAMVKWIGRRAAQPHEVRLTSAAAQQVFDLIGPEFGIIDQELAKLALCIEPEEAKSGVSPERVVEIVGGWRTKTAWELLDAACDGNAGEALQQLDRLLTSGEYPQAMFGAFSWSLRRFAAAARTVEQWEREGKRGRLSDALQAAGFRPFPQGALQRAEQQLRQLGRERAVQIYQWLLELDLQLKGTHASPDRSRFALEMLLLRVSRAARPAS